MFSSHLMAFQGVRVLLEMGQMVVVNCMHLANTNLVLYHVCRILPNTFLIAGHPVRCGIYGVGRCRIAVAND